MRQNQQKALRNKKQKNQSSKKPTLLDHIRELRARLFWVVAVLVVASAVGFELKDHLIRIVMAPLHGEKLIYLTPGGGFSFIFTISLYFGALIAIPVVVFHVYRFLQPVFREPSRKLIAGIMLLSMLLAMTGATFGYFVAVPSAINFLMTFAGDTVTASLTAESYLGFVVAYIFGLAVLFQLPLIINLIDYSKPLPPGMLLSSQSYAIIGATVAAAIITPTPDVVNMAIVAVPIIIMYELGIMAVAIRHGFYRKTDTRPVVQATDIIPMRNTPPAPAPVRRSEGSSVSTHKVSRPRVSERVVKSKHAAIHPVHPAAAIKKNENPGLSSPHPTRRTRSIDGFYI